MTKTFPKWSGLRWEMAHERTRNGNEGPANLRRSVFGGYVYLSQVRQGLGKQFRDGSTYPVYAVAGLRHCFNLALTEDANDTADGQQDA